MYNPGVLAQMTPIKCYAMPGVKSKFPHLAAGAGFAIAVAKARLAGSDETCATDAVC
jgi:hypothetical protein